jgi:alanyl-tRNA synthetase
VPHADVKGRKDVMQFFGDKYGDTVRVLQIGGGHGKLDGYSMELCGGTHTRATGEIGLFRIVGESAIAAGVRRIEAVAGMEAYRKADEELHFIKTLAGKVNSPVHELEKKIEVLLAHQKELEKNLRTASQKEAAGRAKELTAQAVTVNGVPAIIANFGEADGNTLQSVVDSLKSQFKGVVVLGGVANGAVTLVAAVSSGFHGEDAGGKNHPANRAPRRRQGRRPAGQRARRRQGCRQAGHCAGEGQGFAGLKFGLDGLEHRHPIPTAVHLHE